MIYDCIEILPDNVKASLDETGQKKWMDAFNKTVKKSKMGKSYRDAVFEAWQAVRDYPGCRYFSGLVSTEDLDKQNDVVEVNKAFEKIAKHIERGGTMVDTHTNRTVGSFIYVEKTKSRTGQPAIKAHSVIFQGEPYYDSAWEQIKKGQNCPTCRDVRKGFSIGGFALDTKNTCDSTGCHREILDMSIHEISICQEPANPEAVIQDVNMMAKSESEIEKGLRNDEAAVEHEMQHEVPEVMAEAPQALAEGEEMQEAVKKKPSKFSLEDIKEMKDNIEKLRAILNSSNEESGEVPSVPSGLTPKTAAVSGAGKSCGCIDDNIHTSVGESKCPRDEKLYGDVKDPQVRDEDVKFLENKNIEAEPAASKKHGDEAMPMKDGFTSSPVKTEKGPEGPASETKEEAGLYEKSNLTPSGSVSEGKVDHTGGSKSNKDYKYDLEPKKGTENVKDDGDKREKNFNKEGKDLLQKCPGDKKAEIPEELLPMFQDFLKEKGLKMEPEVEAEEIEETIEKTLYVDSDISELDLKEMSDATVFDSYEMLGKVATQKLRIKDIDTNLRLAKTLQIVSIDYLVEDADVEEIFKSAKKKI